MTREQKIAEARKYLETGGLGEVIGFTDLALQSGQDKVQCDTDMAMALCQMASEVSTPSDAIEVLDHGSVRLVDHMGSDLSIVRAARVSYDAAWRAGEDQGSDTRLIQRLWRDRHTSPFEAVEFQFEVFAPIFVFRQWHRHRTWSFSELSARYRELPEVFYVPDAGKVGEQSTVNKQGRQPGDEGLLNQRGHEIENVLIPACQSAFAAYRLLLESGWPLELARSVLPVNTYSHMFAKIDLRNLLHFLDLRLDPHAQMEIRVYAEAIVDLVRPIVPVAIAAWEGSRHV